MLIKTLAFAALVVFAEARFGQEQCQPALSDIEGVTSGGQPGQADSIAGGAIGTLLASADPCEQLKTADSIIATLGTGNDSVTAAKAFLNCEKNFNPFVQDTPTLCSDPTLPTTAIIRGVLPKIDPSVGGATLANQLAAQSLLTPFDATGKSIADIFVANGFSNFTTEDAAGITGNVTATASNASASAAATPSAATTSAAADADVCAAETQTTTTTSAATTLATVTTSTTAAAAASTSASSNATSSDPTASGGGSVNNTVSTISGLNFGTCNPGMIFESGLDNRPATEFTFQAADAAIRAIQEEALNFNIITNRICDSLTNFCGANQAAKDKCASAMTAVADLARVRSTADSWNTMLGFEGQDTNPDDTSTVGEPTS